MNRERTRLGEKDEIDRLLLCIDFIMDLNNRLDEIGYFFDSQFDFLQQEDHDEFLTWMSEYNMIRNSFNYLQEEYKNGVDVTVKLDVLGFYLSMVENYITNMKKF